MIRITCTSCKAVLSIDDAFAGGVCRCQHCGTIQTVPARLKGAVEGQQIPATAESSSRTLYQSKERATAVGSGSGLDDLAGIVASSGLSDTRLRKKPPETATVLQKNPMLLLAIAGGVIVLLIVAVLVLWLRSGSTAPADSSTNAPATPPSAFAPGGPGQVIEPENPPQETPKPKPAPAAVAGPNFCGVPLSANSVVYLVDNGSSSAKILDYVKSALYASIASLGPQKQFQIIFWNTQSPTYGPATATPGHIDEAKAKVDDVFAAGSTDPIESLKKAIAGNPGEIVFITGKGGDLDDATTQAVLAARGTSPVKIHVIDINGYAGDTAAANIAGKTGGRFTPLSESILQGFGN